MVHFLCSGIYCGSFDFVRHDNRAGGDKHAGDAREMFAAGRAGKGSSIAATAR